jgi:membrane fusion protein
MITRQIHLQMDDLDRQMEQTRLLATQKTEGQQEQLQSLRRQLLDVDAQIGFQRDQAASYEAVLERIKPLLSKGFVSSLQVQDEEARLLQAKADQRGLTRQKEQMSAQISDIASAMAQLPTSTATKVSELTQQKEKLSSSLAENEADRAAVIRAPVDGEVSALLAKEGASVNTGQPLISLLPKGSWLDAELLVPSVSIGFIRPGAGVALHYQPFPYEKFGVQQGTVTHVSSVALTPDEITQLMGTKPPDEPMYRVTVRIPAQSVAAYGHDIPLKAGMVLDANILLDDRRISEWIFEPLYALSRSDTAKDAHP